jgi:hypothetical protein
VSKVARVIGIVAAVVAVAASIAVTLGGSGFLIAGIAATTIAAAASAVSAIAMAVSQATMKPPDMKGTVSQVVIGANLPVPYAMGRTYIGGVMVYDNAAGGSKNVDRTQIMVASAGGPIDAFEKILADYSGVTFASESGGLISGVATGWYGADGGYLWANSRKGAHPETALAPAAGRWAWRSWGANHKLSGLAAYSLTMEFDEDGERFASGVPQFGALIRAVKVYDPRADSTYPGGSGAQRWDDEATWAYSANPALHFLTYARGRFANGKRTVGCGLPQESIRFDEIVAWANQCDSNNWKVGGAVWDGAGINRWDNLKRIAQAGGAAPVWSGGKLGAAFSAPKTPVFTITADDLADGEVSIQAMQSFRDRVNTFVPRVRLETHRWEYVQLDAVVGSTYLSEDGETKTREEQLDLVQSSNQGAQLAALEIADSRELGPITLPLKPRFMLFSPGEAGSVDLPELGLEDQLCIITSRAVDPATGTVTLTLRSETTAKHAWALSLTGSPPPTPVLFPPEEVDQVVGGSNPPASIALQPSLPGFTFIDGIPADAGAVITIDALQSPADSVISWSASPPVTLGTVDNDTRTLSLADFGDNAMVTLTATNGAGAVTSLVIPRIDITTPGDSIIPDSDFYFGGDPTFDDPPWSMTDTWGRVEF